MRNFIIRKLVVILIVLIPVLVYSDCKKQAKCGCSGDVLLTLTKAQTTVYWTSESSIYFTLLSNPYNLYYFCNPGAMFSNLADSKSGDIMLLSGDVFWDCNYLYQASNSYYNTAQRIYQVQVTELFSNLYGGQKTPVDK